MDILKLIGVVVVVVGFALKLDTLATVVVAGLVTGLVAGMTPMEILTVLGNSFLTQRTATLFVLTLPVIGICERYGLKDKAVDLIRSIKSATTGRVESLYLVIRAAAAAFSLRIGGHPQFVRPLINPMAQGAAVAKYGKIDEKTEDEIKGESAAAENYGNFFAQNCFMGASGTLLIVSTLVEQAANKGLDPAVAESLSSVDALGIASHSVPIAIITVIVGCASFLLYDKKLDKRFAGKKAEGK